MTWISRMNGIEEEEEEEKKRIFYSWFKRGVCLFSA